MISTAYTLLYSFFEGITYISNILYLVLNVSCYVGYAVISFISNIYQCVSVFFGSVWNVLSIVYYDFRKFLSENGQIVAYIAITINDLLNLFKDFVWKCVFSIYIFYENLTMTFTHLVSSSFDIIYNSFIYVKALVKLGKYSFVFTGTIVWNSVTSIPLYIKTSITNIVLKIQHLSVEFASFFHDVSLESLLGLAIASILIYVSILYRDVIFKLSFAFVKLIIKLCSKAFISILKIKFGFTFTFFKKEKSKSRPQNNEDLEKLQRELHKEKEERVCIICREDNKNVIFLPCRHFCTCEHCSEIILNSTSTCPLCRQFIVRFINVYS